MPRLTECALCGEQDFKTKLIVGELYCHPDCIATELEQLQSHNKVLRREKALLERKLKKATSDLKNISEVPDGKETEQAIDRMKTIAMSAALEIKEMK